VHTRRIKTNAEKALIPAAAAAAMFMTNPASAFLTSQLISENTHTHTKTEREREREREIWELAVLFVGCASIGGFNIYRENLKIQL